jgi:hypothetical protein
MGDDNLTGADLAHGFAADVVEPILAENLPRLRYAAARLGSGSDVLGLDDATSRDHDWGCRLTLLVDSADREMVPAIDGLLAECLPSHCRGYPVRFATTWDPVDKHRVEVATVGSFAATRLGVDPVQGLTVPDWLSLTGQSILEVIAGPVFTDQTTELTKVRDLLRWYPPDLERYVLSAAWQRIDQQMPFVGRTAERGDELGSRLLSAQLADDLMWLAFALSRQWPPYRKWRGTAFKALPVAADLANPLAVATTASGWRQREDGLAAAIEILVGLQQALGLPAPASGVTGFFDRPYRTLNDQVQQGLLAGVTDPEVAALPRGVGPVERWSDNVDVLSSPGRRAALRSLYRSPPGSPRPAGRPGLSGLGQ